MKTAVKHYKQAIQTIHGLVVFCALTCPVLTQAQNAKNETKVIKFSEFSALYKKDKNFQEVAERFRKMEDYRKTAQESLERLMKQKGRTSELELRYGELILQRSRDLEQFGMELQMAGEEKEGQDITRFSKKLAQDGLSIHQKILAQQPNHALADQVYLGVARTQYSLGQKEAALRSSELGIKKIRKAKSDTALHLWIVKGDSAFDLAKGGLALNAYSEADKVATAGTLDAAYVIYKLGWSYYNLKDSESAIRELDRLFAATKDQFALRQEAVQDYALFASDLSGESIKDKGGFAGLLRHLEKVSDTDSARKAIKTLGAVMAKNGRRNSAIECYEFLIDHNRDAPDNIDIALTVVNWSHSLADKWKLTEKYHWLLSSFGPTSSWYKKQSHRPEIQKTAYVKTEESLRKFSMALHEEAMKDEAERTRTEKEDAVAKLYDAYLEAFKEEARIHFYRAEIYRGRKNWNQAGKHYDSFVKLIKLIPASLQTKLDLKLKEEATLAAVQVWSKAIDQDKAWVESMLESSDRFVEDLPTHAMAPQIMLDAAMVEFKSGKSGLALTRIDNLVQKYPKTKQCGVGVNAALDILNKEGDFVNLSQKARLWIDSIDTWVLPQEKEKLSNELKLILAQTEAKACEVLTKDKNRELEGALCLENYAKGFKDKNLAPKSLLLAAEIYDKTNRTQAALGALESLVKTYPSSEQALIAFSRLATAYERNFEFEKAAEIFDVLLKRAEKNQEKDKIALRLLVLNHGLGRDKEEAAILKDKSISERVKKEFLDTKVAYDLVELRTELENSGIDKNGFKSTRAKKLHEGILEHKNLLTLEAKLELARIAGMFKREQGKLDEADKEWMAGLKQFWSASKTPDSWEAAARLRLEQASFWEIQFMRTSLDEKVQKKIELFRKVENWYAEVIQMKSPVVAMEALWKSAELYSKFGTELENSKHAEAKAQAESMKQKSQIFIREIAKRARDWKIVSPPVLKAFALVNPELASTGNQVQFPWGVMPRWLDLSTEQTSWKEWTEETRSLERTIKNSSSRSDQKRAAFVYVAKENSLKNPLAANWMKVLNNKNDIQIKIQALISDAQFRMAQLVLEQYQDLFKPDAFSHWAWGQLEWSRGNYATAYTYWIQPSPYPDFRGTFWRLGWNAAMEEIVEGEVSTSNKKDYFNQLSKLSQNHWQKHLLANLCIQSLLKCDGAYDLTRVAEILKSPTENHYASEYRDGKSGLHARSDALVNYAKVISNIGNTPEEIAQAQAFLDEAYKLRKKMNKPENLVKAYQEISQKMNARQEAIRQPASTNAQQAPTRKAL